MARGTGKYEALRRPGLSRKRCSVEGCEARASFHSLCEAHYPARRLCSVEGCDRTHVAKGYCAMHYRRSKRGDGEVGSGGYHRNPARPAAVCSQPGCDANVVAHGVCGRHRYHRIGDVLEPVDGE